MPENESIRQVNCCLSTFLDCHAWKETWLRHKGVFCISAYGIAWCGPADLEFASSCSLRAVSVIAIEHDFILSDLPNIQDALSSIKIELNCINGWIIKYCVLHETDTYSKQLKLSTGVPVLSKQCYDSEFICYGLTPLLMLYHHMCLHSVIANIWQF